MGACVAVYLKLTGGKKGGLRVDNREARELAPAEPT